MALRNQGGGAGAFRTSCGLVKSSDINSGSLTFIGNMLLRRHGQRPTRQSPRRINSEIFTALIFGSNLSSFPIFLKVAIELDGFEELVTMRKDVIDREYF